MKFIEFLSCSTGKVSTLKTYGEIDCDVVEIMNKLIKLGFVLIILIIFAHPILASGCESEPKEQPNQITINKNAKSTKNGGLSLEKNYKSKRLKINNSKQNNTEQESNIFNNYKFWTLIVDIIIAVILFWTLIWVRKYAKTAKAELSIKELPKISCTIPQNMASLRNFIVIENKSDQNTAVRINLNMKFGNKEIDCGDNYNGKRYWNLGPWGGKTGHIFFPDLFKDGGILCKETFNTQQQNIFPRINDLSLIKEDEANQGERIRFIRSLFNSIPSNTFGESPILMMDIEIICERQNLKQIKYPKERYKYNNNKCIWVPTLTSDNPYWEIS